MKRDLLEHLKTWKTSAERVPLIIRGGRQVGKTWLIRHFAESFDTFIEINLEEDRHAHRIFEENLTVKDLIQRIKLHTNLSINPGNTLLFLDEIQECENALKALRYFKEQYPQLHVIAAGSLIDFSLNKIGMPVGRVEFMYLYPLSFGEFLTAQGRENLREQVLKAQSDTFLHDLMQEHLKNYMCLGGMPAVVQAWISHQDYQVCQKLQDRIILNYQQDFRKYAKYHQVPFVEKIFESVPLQLGSKFQYVRADAELKSRELKQALFLLMDAGVIYSCYHSSAQGFPLKAQINEKKFKTFFLDIGLVQRILSLDMKHWLSQGLNMKVVGSLAEQFVAQEYLAYTSAEKPPELYYWHREAKSSNAEVDFLFVKEGAIVPVEVKSGKSGRLRSLHSFLDSHEKSKRGLKISEAMFASQSYLEEIAFYQIEAWLKNML